MQGLKTTYIYYFTISWDQEFRRSLSGSSARVWQGYNEIVSQAAFLYGTQDPLSKSVWLLWEFSSFHLWDWGPHVLASSQLALFSRTWDQPQVLATLPSHGFFHNMKVKVKVTQSCPTLCDPMNYTVHEILTRLLEWVAFSFSRGSSQPRDWTQVSCIAGRFFTSWATR